MEKRINLQDIMHELTKENPITGISKLCEMNPEALKQAFLQVADFGKTISDAFKRYIDSCDESRNKIHESVKQVLDILDKCIAKSERPSDQLIKEVLQVSKEIVRAEADMIAAQEHGKMVAWGILGGTCVLALAFGFFWGCLNGKNGESV